MCVAADGEACGRGSGRAGGTSTGTVRDPLEHHVRVEAHPGSVAVDRRRRRRPAGGGPRRRGSPCRSRRGSAATRGGSPRARPPTRPRRVASATSAGPTAVARGPGCAVRPRRLAGPAGGDLRRRPGPRHRARGRAAPGCRAPRRRQPRPRPRRRLRSRRPLFPSGVRPRLGPVWASATAVTGTLVPRVDPTGSRPRRRRKRICSAFWYHSACRSTSGADRDGTEPSIRRSLSRGSGHGRG